MRRVKCGSMQREGGSWKVLMRNRLKTNSEWPQSGPVTPLSFNEVVKHQKRQCGIHAVCTDLWCAPDKQGGTASDIGHHTIWVQKDPGCTIEVTRPCNSILDCRGRFFDLQEISLKLKNSILFSASKVESDTEYVAFMNNLMDYNKDSETKEASAVLSGLVQFVVKLGLNWIVLYVIENKCVISLELCFRNFKILVFWKTVFLFT